MQARSHLPTGIILAAGLSSRMHRPKQLLPWGSGTVIEGIARRVRGRLPETIVVLGHLANEISPMLADVDVRIVVNQDYEHGMLSSVKCGIAAATGAPAYLVFLGDQPVVDDEVIDAVVHVFGERGRGIVVPVFEGQTRTSRFDQLALCPRDIGFGRRGRAECGDSGASAGYPGGCRRDRDRTGGHGYS